MSPKMSPRCLGLLDNFSAKTQQ